MATTRTATDESGRTRKGRKAHPNKVERDKLLREVERDTRKIAELQEEAVEIGHGRRHKLLKLNRKLGVPYSRLAEVTGLAPSRLTIEIGKAKDEAGITAQHPLYPRFGANGR